MTWAVEDRVKGLRQEKYSITQKKGLTPKTTSLHCVKKFRKEYCNWTKCKVSYRKCCEMIYELYERIHNMKELIKESIQNQQ
jgi:hypothetical protein